VTEIGSLKLALPQVVPSEQLNGDCCGPPAGST
jgi:hypothetical protein